MSKKICLLGIIVFLLLLLLPLWGIVPINWQTILKSNSNSFVFWQLRVPRTLLGFVSGSILALSGLVCQNLFKNNLATPDLLGISSGAAAGAVLALKFNLFVSFLGLGGLVLFSYLGALSAVLFVLLISRILRNASLYTFLMCGVALNFFYSALIVFFQYLFDFSNTFSLLRWLMGGISVVGYHVFLQECILIGLGRGSIRAKPRVAGEPFQNLFIFRINVYCRRCCFNLRSYRVHCLDRAAHFKAMGQEQL
jgi:iron complex transport system permease protein